MPCNRTQVKFNRIQEVLNEDQRSQKWLSGQLNVSVVTVSNWHRNQKEPSIQSLFRISDVLQCEPKELINYGRKGN